jgi:SAM-dependent methyltransferase
MNENSYRSRVYARYVSASPALRENAAHDLLVMRGPYLRRLIRHHFPADRDAKILDFGCGPGTIINHARALGYRNIEGVDASREQVERAANLGIPGVRLGDIVETANELPPESVDAVITFDVIEHFGRDELFRFAEAVHRITKQGGRWIIHVPNAESLFGALGRYGDLTHELSFTRNSINQLLGPGGWRVQCFEDTPPIHGAASLVRAILWRGVRIGLLFLRTIEDGHPDRGAIFSQNLLAVAYK